MTIRHWQLGGTRRARRLGRMAGTLFLGATLWAVPGLLAGQDVIQTAAERKIRLSIGSSALFTHPDTITRATVADENIAYQLPFPPNQLLINGTGIGSTTMVVWGRTGGQPRMYTIEVTADVASLQTQVDELFPGSGLTVTSTGSAVVLSGEVRDPSVVGKVEELAQTQGIPVVNNVVSPAPEQILLKVEFAEVSRSVIHEVGGDLVRILNPETLDRSFDKGDTHQIEAVSEGFVTLLIEGDGSRLDAIIRALKNTGEFKSLAQPNLVTREGQEASFLAGGEFPFPSIQTGGGNANAVTIQWREFGIRLNFTPTITNAGNVRLQVAPEVSSLDFANGLTFQGYNIPSLLSRKVQTDVELRPGQTLAIGGLMDNSMLHDVDKIPVLGDIPILGFFFRSESARQDRTELLVLVTPYILDMDNLPTQALPTGDPASWDWDRHIREWLRERSIGGGGMTSNSGGGGA